MPDITLCTVGKENPGIELCQHCRRDCRKWKVDCMQSYFLDANHEMRDSARKCKCRQFWKNR